MELIDYFSMLYDYNRWANVRMLEAAAALTPEQIFHWTNLPSSSKITRRY
jgi:uncharacterized damage-inducible protein DinB